MADRPAGQSSIKATPAENVLLRALGLVADDLVVDESAVQELKGMFESPLREHHVCAIASLLGKILPSSVSWRPSPQHWLVLIESFCLGAGAYSFIDMVKVNLVCLHENKLSVMDQSVVV